MCAFEMFFKRNRLIRISCEKYKTKNSPNRPKRSVVLNIRNVREVNKVFAIHILRPTLNAVKLPAR